MSHNGMKDVALNFLPILLACGIAFALLWYLSTTPAIDQLLNGSNSPTPSP